jgi:hypothetical protein
MQVQKSSKLVDFTRIGASIYAVRGTEPIVVQIGPVSKFQAATIGQIEQKIRNTGGYLSFSPGLAAVAPVTQNLAVYEWSSN